MTFHILKRNKRKLAIFDLDNTLIDSKKKLEVDVIEAMERLGHKIPYEESKGEWYEMAAKYGISKEKFDESFDQRRSWKEVLELGEIPLFEDTIPCLEKLRKTGTHLALLSRSKQEYTDQKLDYLDLRKYFEQVAVVNPKEPTKARRAIEIVSAIGPNNIDRAYCIGDKYEDLAIGRNIQNRFRINSTGVGIKREGYENRYPQESYQIDSLNGLPEIIENGK